MSVTTDSTETIDRTAPSDLHGEDRERFSHIVVDPDGTRRAEAIVLEARINGTPVTALCGKVWTPSRDPQRFPVCPECKQAKDALLGR